MKMPMQSLACLCCSLPLRHLTHTHTRRDSPPNSCLRACVYVLTPTFTIMRRVCICMSACAIIAFLYICLLLISVFFLFSLIFFMCVCVLFALLTSLSLLLCLRRVHKCKFTRTFEICSHSGTKTIVRPTGRQGQLQSWEVARCVMGTETMEFSSKLSTHIPTYILYICMHILCKYVCTYVCLYLYTLIYIPCMKMNGNGNL